MVFNCPICPKSKKSLLRECGISVKCPHSTCYIVGCFETGRIPRNTTDHAFLCPLVPKCKACGFRTDIKEHPCLCVYNSRLIYNHYLWM